jgi:hypothetical protein
MMLKNTTWVCGACGREGVSRDELRNRDSSCGTWAVEVYVDSIVRDRSGRLVSAKATGSQR